MSDQILFGKEAREKLLVGVSVVANAVVTTLGPNGRNCVIMRSVQTNQGLQFYLPHYTKDGFTVARSISLTDQYENAGAFIIKNAAQKTVEQAGDGTTSTCLLMLSIVKSGLQLVDLGANPMELKKGIDAAVEIVVNELKKVSTPIEGDIEKIRQVATVSANNDVPIGNLIAEAFEKIGFDGIINIEEAKGTKTEIKTTEGVSFPQGWKSAYFVNNQARQECVLENPYILLYDKKISHVKPMEGILSSVLESGRSLLIICEDADGDALAGLAANAHNKQFPCCIVRSPEFAEKKREAMEDLAILTGGKYISDEKGMGLQGMNLSDLGQAQKAIVSKEETIIVSGNSNKKILGELVDNLKMDITKAGSEEKFLIENRIAKLTGGIAVLYVGGPTEVEMKERKDRCDDAIRATKAAIEEGFVPGGGTAFLSIEYPVLIGESDFEKGQGVVRDILSKPLEQICLNAGVDSRPIIDQIRAQRGLGYNARTEKVEDLVKAGVIDPVKVLRCSLENAASAAGMIITSETLIWGTPFKPNA